MSSFTKFYDGYSKIIKDMKGARRMRGGDKANVLERYPKAVCVYLDGEFDRYGVKLEEHGKVISSGRTAAQAWRIVKKAAKVAGISWATSPHWLRHAHASHALENGATVKLVSETLGHGSVAITSRYLHARPGESSSQHLKVG